MNNTERTCYSTKAHRVLELTDIYDAGATRTVAEVHNDFGPGNGKDGTTTIVWMDGSFDHYPANYTLYEVR